MAPNIAEATTRIKMEDSEWDGREMHMAFEQMKR